MLMFFENPEKCRLPVILPGGSDGTGLRLADQAYYYEELLNTG